MFRWRNVPTNGRVQVFDTEGNFAEVIARLTKTYTADWAMKLLLRNLRRRQFQRQAAELHPSGHERPGQPQGKSRVLGDIYPGRVW